MTDASDGENSPTTPCPVAAYDRAALILAESLLHGLLKRSVITLREAVEIVNVAIEIHTEVVDETGVATEAVRHSHSSLVAVGASLKLDLADVDRNDLSGPPNC